MLMTMVREPPTSVEDLKTLVDVRWSLFDEPTTIDSPALTMGDATSTTVVFALTVVSAPSTIVSVTTALVGMSTTLVVEPPATNDSASPATDKNHQ